MERTLEIASITDDQEFQEALAFFKVPPHEESIALYKKEKKDFYSGLRTKLNAIKVHSENPIELEVAEIDSDLEEARAFFKIPHEASIALYIQEKKDFQARFQSKLSVFNSDMPAPAKTDNVRWDDHHEKNGLQVLNENEEEIEIMQGITKISDGSPKGFTAVCTKSEKQIAQEKAFAFISDTCSQLQCLPYDDRLQLLMIISSTMDHEAPEHTKVELGYEVQQSVGYFTANKFSREDAMKFMASHFNAVVFEYDSGNMFRGVSAMTNHLELASKNRLKRQKK